MIADYLTIHCLFVGIIKETQRFLFQFSHRFSSEIVYSYAIRKSQQTSRVESSRVGVWLPECVMRVSCREYNRDHNNIP